MIDFVYRHPDGRRQRIRHPAQTKNKRQAEAEERAIRGALADGTYGGEEVTDAKRILTLAEFGEEFLTTYAKARNRPSEVEAKEGNLRRYLLPAMGSLTLDQIGVLQVDHLVAELREGGLSAKTINNCLGTLRTMLRYAERVGIIDQAPFIQALKLPKPEFDFLLPDELERLLAAAEREQDEGELRDMILFAARTGARWGELCELRVGDVDLVTGRLVIRRAFARGHVGPPKSGRDREVPLSPAVVAMLKRRRHLRGELVFCLPDGERHDYHRTVEALKRVCRRAELRLVKWHCYRHTFASHLIMSGASIKEVQELLGHSTIQMTMRYAHLSPSVKRDAVTRLDRLTGDAWQQRGNEAAQAD